MPNNVIKTQRDEHKWSRAEEIAAKSGKGKDYAYIMGIYKKMKPDHKFKKTASVEYRGHTFPGYNIPVKSDRPNKKKMVLVKRGDKIKLVHFGHSSYKHNYSKKAKSNYLSRSGGIRDKEGRLTKNDPFSPNYWARKVLWPKGQKADGSSLKKTAGKVSTGILIESPPSEEVGVRELQTITLRRKEWKPNKLIDHYLDQKIPETFENILKDAGIAFEKGELRKVVKGLRGVILRHKNYFRRLRPHFLAKKHGITFDHDYDSLPSAHTLSYPSGHTTQGYYLAHMLSDRYPKLRKKFFSLAKKVADARIHRGVHFPSDNSAGEVLAKKLYDLHTSKMEKTSAIIAAPLGAYYGAKKGRPYGRRLEGGAKGSAGAGTGSLVGMGAAAVPILRKYRATAGNRGLMNALKHLWGRKKALFIANLLGGAVGYKIGTRNIDRPKIPKKFR
tara:strand:- start:8868 stop:10199 length:1332 start_codon:yes stop_codon:yes gene_type:complete